MTSLNPILKSDLRSDSVHTLADLDQWPDSGTSLAVLGHPVCHSLSPPMHNAALAELAETDADFKSWTYYKFDIEPNQLREALNKFEEHNFLGLNLTVPHKVLAAQWVKIGEPEVKLSGACNTLLRTPEGFTGYNTDLYGMTRAIETEFDVRLKERDVILLGAGGAARAAAIACAQAGVQSLTLANRTPSKLEPIINCLNKLDSKPQLTTVPLPGRFVYRSDRLLIINATSLGLKAEDPSPIPLNELPSNSLVFDMIYNPARTALLKQAESLGMKTANGLRMLAYQGERSLKIWSKKNPSAKTMFEAALAGLNRF